MYNDITLIFRPILNGIGPSGTHGSRDFRICYYQTVMLSCGGFIHNSVTWIPFTTMKNTDRLLYTHQGVIQNIQSFNAKNNMMQISTGSNGLITTEVARTPLLNTYAVRRCFPLLYAFLSCFFFTSEHFP